jgi:hypothetical protein
VSRVGDSPEDIINVDEGLVRSILDEDVVDSTSELDVVAASIAADDEVLELDEVDSVVLGVLEPLELVEVGVLGTIVLDVLETGSVEELLKLELVVGKAVVVEDIENGTVKLVLGLMAELVLDVDGTSEVELVELAVLEEVVLVVEIMVEVELLDATSGSEDVLEVLEETGGVELVVAPIMVVLEVVGGTVMLVTGRFELEMLDDVVVGGRSLLVLEVVVIGSNVLLDDVDKLPGSMRDEEVELVVV